MDHHPSHDVKSTKHYAYFPKNIYFSQSQRSQPITLALRRKRAGCSEGVRAVGALAPCDAVGVLDVWGTTRVLGKLRAACRLLG